MRPGLAGAGLLAALWGGLLAADVALARELRPLLGAVPGAYLPFPRQLLGLAAATLVPAFLPALLFPAAADLLRGGRSGPARAYAWESAGAAAGGLASTAASAAGLSNLAGVLACAVLAAVLGAFLAARDRRRLAGCLALLGAAFAAAGFAAPLDRAMTAWTVPGLAVTRDSPYGRLSVARQGEQVVLYANGALAYDSQSTDPEVFVHLAALQHPRPSRVLILEAGGEGLAREALEHRPELVECVEVDGVRAELARRFLGAASAAVVRVADPRRFVREGAGGYDLILVGAAEPSSGQENRLFTREFFADCAARLRTGGVLALRLPSSEAFRPPELWKRDASVYGALRLAFRHVALLPASPTVLAASQTPLPAGPAEPSRRLRERVISSGLVTPAYLAYAYGSDRFRELPAALGRAGARVNTDLSPAAYAHAARLWLARLLSPAAVEGLFALRPSPWWAAAGLAALGLARLLGGRARLALLAGVSGFAAMLTEAAVALYFQARTGILFGELGALLAAFMAGMAGGSRAGEAFGGAGRGWGALLVASFAGFELALAASLERGWLAGLAEAAVALGACGFLAGALFAWTSLASRDARAAASALYAADLAGSALGAALGSAFLLPGLGLAASTRGLAAALAAALVLVF